MAMTIRKGHTMKIRRHVIRFLCLLGLWVGVGLQAHAQTDTVTYVYTDPQGTPLVRADASGNVIARYDYTPYGNAVASLGSPPNGPGYTGHVNDPETGLVYMQARYYQPDGRFLSPDPMGPAAGNIYSFNRYAYATNNPIINSDPTGRQSASDFAKLNSCAGACSLVMMDGQWQAVGSTQAATSMLAQQNGGTISDYTPATRQETAVAMDNVNIGAATASKLSGGTFVIADVVDESSAVLALALDPSLGRLFTVATAGMFSGLKAQAKGNEAATAAIERADRANTAKDLLIATQPGNTNNSTQSPQQAPSSTAPQSPSTPQQRVVTPALHPLDE
jgi:RHS repeat-associated protein